MNDCIRTAPALDAGVFERAWYHTEMDVRNAIWLALLHSARWERYYGVLASRYRRLEAVVRAVLLASAMGSVTSFISDMPAAVRIACGLVVATVVIVDFVVKPGQTAATLAVIRDECGRLRLALDDLLRQHPHMDETQASAALGVLNSNLHNITAKDPTAWSAKVNEETTRAAFAELESIYVS